MGFGDRIDYTDDDDSRVPTRLLVILVLAVLAILVSTIVLFSDKRTEIPPLLVPQATEEFYTPSPSEPSVQMYESPVGFGINIRSGSMSYPSVRIGDGVVGIDLYTMDMVIMP